MEAGEIPTSSDEQSLTGGATSVEKDCPPTLQPVTTCYIDAETGQEVCQQQRDAAGNLMYTEVAGECVKQLTPGQIWNANDRVTAGERIAGEDGYINGAADRVEEGKEQSKTIIGTIDCSKTPRPKQCDFGFDPTDE